MYRQLVRKGGALLLFQGRHEQKLGRCVLSWLFCPHPTPVFPDHHLPGQTRNDGGGRRWTGTVKIISQNQSFLFSLSPMYLSWWWEHEHSPLVQIISSELERSHASGVSTWATELAWRGVAMGPAIPVSLSESGRTSPGMVHLNKPASLGTPWVSQTGSPASLGRKLVLPVVQSMWVFDSLCPLPGRE